MDMMAKLDIVELNTAFNDYKFYETEHYYTYKGKRVNTSVTQFVESKSKPFDEKSVSEYVAKKTHRLVEDVLREWKYASDLACNSGTLFHLRSEQLAANKEIEIDYSALQLKNTLLKDKVKERLDRLIPMQDKFFKDVHNKLIPIKTEFTVGLEDKIAGNIDLLCWNVREQEYQIWDYKTNKNIRVENKYEKLLDEFSDLDNCELNKYSIQLGTYKELLKRKLNLNIGKCYIIWFNENNEDYKIYKCIDLEKEIAEAIDKL